MTVSGGKIKQYMVMCKFNTNKPPLFGMNGELPPNSDNLFLNWFNSPILSFFAGISITELYPFKHTI